MTGPLLALILALAVVMLGCALVFIEHIHATKILAILGTIFAGVVALFDFVNYHS